MKKIRLLLALIATSIGSWQGAWARTAPTMPEPQVLESGKTFYLYNVGSDRFLSFDTSNSNGYPLASTDQGKAVKISLVNGTQYNIMFVEGSRYWNSSSDIIYSWYDSSANSDSYHFTITEFEGGYTIQRVAQANQEEFIGYDGRDGNRIYTNVKEGNIVWQLMDVNDAARYIAKRNLYRALESAEGYTVDKFEAVYEDENSSNDALQEAADILNKAVDASNTIQKPDWSDYKILFEMDIVDPWFYNSNGNSFEDGNIDRTKVLNATIEVNDNATLVYEYNHHWNTRGEMSLYLDGELQYTIDSEEGEEQQRYFLELSPGKHSVAWQFVNTNQDGESNCRLENIGVEHTPTMNVSLLEPGSLGTEVLKNTDHIQNVRKLVISGPMNSDDWERIMMMTSLFSLDLTNAEITEIPESQLSREYHRSNLTFFHEVKLPTTLKAIGNEAFSGTYLDNIVFPVGLETIGDYAFANSRVKKAILPETVTLVGASAFARNESLKTVVYPASAKSIPNGCFSQCHNLQPSEIPEGITSIGYEAFYECYSYRTSIPASVTSIGSYAFNNCNLNNVVICENASVSNEAFEYCKLKTIELPTSMYSAPSRLVKYCSSMTDVYLKSPTMVIPNDIFEGCNANILTVHVPDYLVNAYKQDSYWYNYNIVGFSTEEIKDWYINQPLTLGADARIAGQPNIHMERSGYIMISGDASMTIDNLYTCKDWNGGSWISMLLSTCDNISINGDYIHRVYTPANEWAFICLPFDTKVGDITSESSFAIRYYDGANRAENGSGGNWKNYSKDDIIPAGTGFILQTSKLCSTWFTAQDNASKQYVVQNKEFVKALDANVSDNNANKGWNLIGNPWLTYYNIHKMNFTAPITCWDANNRNYTAYSIIDDDYAIKPGEAFFVQCPDEINSISFPVDGRQLTSVIESQNAIRQHVPTANERKLIDLELSNGELTDKTRFVVNPKAEMDYELNRDASKFFSMDASVPQIYTIENGNPLAINERPFGEGTVQMGFRVAAEGEYTITASRNGFKKITLVDNETGFETNLSTTDSYTFTAQAGTDDQRFELRIGEIAITKIANVNENGVNTNQYFNLNGQEVTTPTKGVYVVNGMKVIVK